MVPVALIIGSIGAGAEARVSDPALCPGGCQRPVSFSLDPSFDSAERELIGEAMTVWRRGTGGRACFEGGGDDLQIQRLDRAEDLRPWDPEWSKHVALTKGRTIWIVAPRVDAPGEFWALLVHELGHYLGIGHIEDTADTYMHSVITDTPDELRDHARLPPRDALAFCAAHRCTCSN